MKVKRRIALLLMVCVLMMTLAVTAFATAEKPYGSYTTTITDGWWFFKDTATATISKCSCNPVDNYLMAGIAIQYLSDGNYYWSPDEDVYYYNSGENTSEESVSTSEANITYAEAWYQARCGEGKTVSIIDSKTN